MRGSEGRRPVDLDTLDLAQPRLAWRRVGVGVGVGGGVDRSREVEGVEGEGEGEGGGEEGEGVRRGEAR